MIFLSNVTGVTESKLLFTLNRIFVLTKPLGFFSIFNIDNFQFDRTVLFVAYTAPVINVLIKSFYVHRFLIKSFNEPMVYENSL